jgi:hypothetical protein
LGRCTVDVVTATATDALLSQVARATAVGALRWEYKKPVTWLGRIEVTIALLVPRTSHHGRIAQLLRTID